jgi:hypothetical protein
MKKIIKTNDATKGGEFVGESHQGENGGMRAIVVDNGKQPILVEGSEVIINKKKELPIDNLNYFYKTVSGKLINLNDKKINKTKNKETIIVNNKEITLTNDNVIKKSNLSFIYLYDINCVYHQMDFKSVIDLKEKVLDIIESKDFGEDLQILSDFIEAPAMFLNYSMRRHKITDYSIFDVEYQPKFKTTPCDKTTFDLKVNINNYYNMDLSISKVDRNEEEDEVDSYKFQFRFMDEIETLESDTLSNVHYFIGSNLAKLLDKKLKNK